MASLQVRNGSYRVLFTYHGKLHAFTLGKVTRAEADGKAKQVDYLLMRLKQRLIAVPEGVDIVTFLQFDGKPAPQALPESPRRSSTLSTLKDRYLATLANGTIESNSLDTCKLHLTHVCRQLGDSFPLSELSLAALQDYINHRTSQKISPTTIKAELATFRAAWNWAGPMKLASGAFPSKGLRYPKVEEKPPFSTMAEIERQIAAGADPQVWWEALYLTSSELAELLASVKTKASHAWIYPLFCFAAHTGARRSEILRATVADVDFSGDTVLIREKKRTKGQRTTRRVPLTPFLRAVLHEWLQSHPGGAALFCHSGNVARSKKRSATTGYQSGKARPTTLKGRADQVRKREMPLQGALTKNEVHDHLRRILKDTKWEKMRGLHCLRHSFISACASKGVDQRLIDAWVGHSTDEQRKRYRHLWPNVQQEAIKLVFA